MHNLLKTCLIFLFIFLSVNLAHAHRLNIFVEKNGNEIKISSYYSGGAKCEDCKVEIYSGNKKIKEGKTDKNGIFLFNLDTLMRLKIVVYDRMGHRAEYEVKDK